MTNEMKLLQELCKALGFQVETIIDREERKETKLTAKRFQKGLVTPSEARRLKRSWSGAMLDIDEDGMYTSYLIDPIISYKLTKTGEEQ